MKGEATTTSLTARPIGTRLPRDPLEVIATSGVPIVLESRYRLLVGGLLRFRRSQRSRWGFALATGGVATLFAVLAARHFATSSWPLTRGNPGLLVAAGLLLLLAQALKAFGWGRLFAPDERPRPLALAAGNGGAALIGVVLPGRFDDAMRVAVVRRYPGCPAGVRALCLSLVMLGLIDSAALAPLAACRRGLSGRRDRRPRRAGGRGCRRSRRRRADRRSASPGREQACCALPARPLAESCARPRSGRDRKRGRSCPPAGSFGRWRSSCSSARSASASRSRSRSCSSPPARRRRHCRSVPRGAATQAGASGAALIASGVGASQALAVAVSVGALGVLSGSAIFLFAVAWRSRPVAASDSNRRLTRGRRPMSSPTSSASLPRRSRKRTCRPAQEMNSVALRSTRAGHPSRDRQGHHRAAGLLARPVHPDDQDVEALTSITATAWSKTTPVRRRLLRRPTRSRRPKGARWS